MEPKLNLTADDAEEIFDLFGIPSTTFSAITSTTPTSASVSPVTTAQTNALTEQMSMMQLMQAERSKEQTVGRKSRKRVNPEEVSSTIEWESLFK